MTAFVALLRGINVGGAGEAGDGRPAADRRGLRVRRCAHVRAERQRGVPHRRLGGQGCRALRSALAAEASIDPAIAIRTAAQLASVVERCPFDDTANVHVTFLVEGAKRAAPDVDADQFEPERFAVGRREVYLYLPERDRSQQDGGDAQPRRAAADGTTRNWRTVTTLLEMARD